MKEFVISEVKAETAILVGLITQEQDEAKTKEYLDELEFLADTAGAVTVKRFTQRVGGPNMTSYVGKGKLAEIKEYIKAKEDEDEPIGMVIFDDELSAKQLRNIENELQVKILDRTSLILDIFAMRAQTANAKTQVELAQYRYMLPRLQRLWTHLERQGGGSGSGGGKGSVGLRGPGETKIEADRRRLRSEMAKLRKELSGMKTAREVKRSQRRASTIPQIAIAGYTNAGKSSLINAMTGAGVLVEDALFATLDPTTRRAELADGRAVVFTDTVGFVRHLPTQLVESFRSTLEEVVEADLVLHVVDGSDPFPLKQIEAVNSVITEIVQEQKVQAPPEIIVVNKIDQADPLTLAELRHVLDDVVFVSARTGEGIAELEARVELFLNSLDDHVTVLIPFTHGGVVARIHELGTVLKEDYTTEGTLIDVRLPHSVATELQDFIVETS